MFATKECYGRHAGVEVVFISLGLEKALNRDALQTDPFRCPQHFDRGTTNLRLRFACNQERPGHCRTFEEL